jgi:phospholipid/cholesterol/gamma-HCH transport system substrate-binding protein
MSPYRRNLLVGITVLGAFAVLGWMILQFGGTLATPFAPSQIHVLLIADHADGLSEGSAVIFRGVTTGRVDRVYLHDQNLVYVDASVDQNPPLPANLKAIIRPNGLIGGGSSVVLEVAGDKPEGELKDKAQLPTEYSGLDLLPPQFAQLATDLSQAAKQFRESNVIIDADTMVKRIGVLSDSLQKITGDAGTQEDLKASIANIRQTSEEFKKFSLSLDQLSTNANSTIAQAHITISKADTTMDTLSRQVGDRLQQTATLIEQLNAITDKVNKGQGTAGALVNDPRLYMSLVETTQEMDATVKDLKRLVEQWEQEGVSLHLK